jgi:hypothetical protein
VTWHFAMNLLPMPFAMIGLMKSVSPDDVQPCAAKGGL